VKAAAPAGSVPGQRPRLSFLVSHAYLRSNPGLRDLVFSLAPFADFLIDSGAYTNYTQWMKQVKTGRSDFQQITVEEYASACQDYEGRLWVYLTLDKISDPAVTWENYTQLLASGVRPIPIMQPGDSNEHYRVYLENSLNNRIAVGGIAGLTGSNSLNFGLSYYSHLFTLSGGTARLHALGVLKWPQMFQINGMRYCDTTTFAGGGRFGEIVFYDEKEGFTKCRFRNAAHVQRHRKMGNLLSFLRECRITTAMLSDPEFYRRNDSIPNLSALFAYLQFHAHAKSRDLTYFFAVSGSQWITTILGVMDCANEHTFDFPAAALRCKELRSMSKSDPGRCIEVCQDILRRKTKWQTLTL